MKTTYILRDGKLVEKPKRKPRPRLHILNDSLDPHWNHAVGKVVDSRTEHKRILREEGYEEIGNEWEAFKNFGPYTEYEAPEEVPQDVLEDLERGI